MKLLIPKTIKVDNLELDQQLREIRHSLQVIQDKFNSLKFRDTISGWNWYNAAINLTAQKMDREFDGNAGSGPTEWVALRPGWVSGVSGRLLANITAGNIRFLVFKNGSPTGAYLEMTKGSKKFVTFTENQFTFIEGDLLDLRMTTNSTWAPTTSEILAEIEVTYAIG